MNLKILSTLDQILVLTDITFLRTKSKRRETMFHMLETCGFSFATKTFLKMLGMYCTHLLRPGMQPNLNFFQQQSFALWSDRQKLIGNLFQEQFILV